MADVNSNKDASTNASSSSSSNISNFSLNSVKIESDDSAVMVSAGEDLKQHGGDTSKQHGGHVSKQDHCCVAGEDLEKRLGKDSVRVGDTNVLASYEPLDTSYDLYCDSSHYRSTQLERLALQEGKALRSQEKSRLCRQLSILGQRDRAVRLLLDQEYTEEG